MTTAASYDPFGPARDLDRYLGDPSDPAVAFSYAKSLELDEREEFPEASCAALTSWGLNEYFVPAGHGGRLHSYEQLLHLIRLVARRDMTVAVGYGKTFLGAVSAWVAGTPRQRADLAARILDGTQVAWALTEREHGSDLLASELAATPGAGGFQLTGEKWLINNATRGRLVAVLARTDPEGGPRGFGVLLVDKDQLAPGTWRCLPKVRTHGIRGADISGIAFTDARLPTAAHLGAPGSGLEVVLKGLQLTRTMCASLALGAGENALRIASAWACSRRLYGRRLADLPAARRVLLDAYTDHLCAEAVAVVSSRMIHWRPEELSLASAAVKYLLPVQAEASVAALGRLLGARSIFADADFQKVARDARIVSLFDGSTVVNLHAVVNQFPVLTRAYRRQRPWSELDEVADVTRPVPRHDPERLRLICPNGLHLLTSLADASRALADLAVRRPGLVGVAALAGMLVQRTDRLHDTIAGLPPARGGAPVAHLEAARHLTLCYAGAAAVTLWLANHSGGAGTQQVWYDGHWLTAVLSRILVALGESVPTQPEADQALWELLTAQADDARLFSLFNANLTPAGGLDG
ncbi:acyl-CoA dehydrogenase family protein [Kribbella sp. NPDC020789]